MAEPLSFNADFTIGAQIDARAQHPVTANKVLLMHGDRTWTYRQFRDESVRMAHFLLRRLGRIDDAHPGHVAMVLENHLELLALYGGCAYGGLTLFGVNTGLRGEVLAGVLNQSRARLLVVDERLLAGGRARAPRAARTSRRRTFWCSRTAKAATIRSGRRSAGLHRRARSAGQQVARCAARSTCHRDRNLMVIYTSGTTGLPKGINNNHMKLCATGIGVSANMGLTQDDVGYACMPLFHSNAMFVGFMPAFWVGGAIGLRERFSASQFVPDVLRYGVTFWNYVGEPVHYVLARHREAVRRRRGAHHRRDHQQPAQPVPLRRRQRRGAAGHRPLHASGWGSKTCSSSTAPPKRRSAPSAARATRAAASARSPTRR